MRIDLVVADMDAIYLQRLCEYINTVYHQKIRIVSFSNQDSLISYFLSGEKADVALINPDFYCDRIKEFDVEVILLSDGRIKNEFDDILTLNKYQPGDKLLGQLIEYFIHKNKNAARLFHGSTQTKIVTVYSPCGGAGKTSIACNLAIQCVLLGKSVFYLNLETLSSSPAFFTADSEKNLSHVLLYLKDNSSLLPLKIESSKVRDIKYNLDFFQPPESSLELSELDKDDMINILLNLREIGKYDVVLVDTNSDFSEKNIALFENSDRIVFLATQDHICNFKIKAMLSEIKKIGLNIDMQLFPVINKYRADSKINSVLAADVLIPHIENVIEKNQGDGFVFNKTFAEYVLSLAKYII